MKEIYDWVPWFAELAKRIADGGERYLVDRAKNVEWGTPVEKFRLFRYGDKNIDPFSFIYTLASMNGTRVRERVFSSVEAVFEVPGVFALDNPEAAIFPTPGSVNTLFHHQGNGNPETMWRLLKGAVQGRRGVQKEDFDDALAVKGVAVNNLTQAIFLINGNEFFPYDKTMQALGLGPEIISKKDFSFEKYVQVMEKIRRVFAGCEPAEINLYAYRGAYTKRHKPFVVSMNVYESGRDLWEDFSSNNWVYSGGTNPDRIWSEPEPGDIVLAREGGRGLGIGIVHENDYADSLAIDSRLHMIWLNKSDRDLLVDTSPTSGFTRDGGEWGDAFRKAYPQTMELLKRFTKKDDLAHPFNTILSGHPAPARPLPLSGAALKSAMARHPKRRPKFASAIESWSRMVRSSSSPSISHTAMRNSSKVCDQSHRKAGRVSKSGRA